jgi:hypothetical protein
MSISRKPTDSITEDDLTDLISNEVREGKTIDYKEQLIGNSDSDKKEFLRDVTSGASHFGESIESRGVERATEVIASERKHEIDIFWIPLRPGQLKPLVNLLDR